MNIMPPKRGRPTTMRNNSAKRSGSRSANRNRTAKRPRNNANYSKTGPMEVEGPNFYKKNSPPKVNMSNAARRALLKRMK